jgi:methyl-accepting chemotaxis protein
MRTALNFTRLRYRLGLAMGSLVALTALAMLAVGWQLRQIDSANQRLQIDRERLAVVSHWATTVRNNLDRAITSTRLDGAILDDEATRTRLAPVHARLSEEMASSAAVAAKAQEQVNKISSSGEAELQALLGQVAKDRARFIAVRAQIRDDLLLGEGVKRIDGELLPLATTMDKSLENVRTRLEGQSAQSASALAAAVTRSMWLLGGACAVALALGSVLALRLARAVTRPIGEAAEVARAIADGDLSQQLGVVGRDEIAELQQALVAMQGSLIAMVGQLRISAENIGRAGAEVASGNQDLAHRTELAASHLQQAASSMTQLTDAVNHTADSARNANGLAAAASEVAARGGSVVADVVATMEEINASSRKIADIVGTIDGIAFQTNILALNAAVEAARAGEQGRGFAVVASEVRSLAQRSAAAAREIKSLIGTSVEKVETGSRLVASAGSTMGEIVASVQRVSDIIGAISLAAGEQSGGIRQINTAVTQLEQMTQQNAALVEESAAAAESLKDQSQQLAQVVATYRTGAVAPAFVPDVPSPAAHDLPAPPRAMATRAIQRAAASPPVAPASRAKPAGVPPPPAATHAAGVSDDWETF